MSIKKTLIKNSLLNIGGYFYLLLASLVSVPLILAKLGEKDFGILLLFTSLVPLASTLDLGISSALIRQLSLPDKDLSYKKKYWQTGLWVYVVTGIISAIIFSTLIFLLYFYAVALRGFSFSDLIAINVFVTLTIFVNHFCSALMALPQADQRFDVYNLRTMISGSGNTIFTGILVFFTQDIKSIIFFQMIFYFLTIFSLYNYAQKKFHHQTLLPSLHLDELKHILNYGLKNFVGNLANQINLQTSKYVIGGMLSAEAITYFGIPQSIVMKAAGGVSQLTLAIFPLSVALSTKEKFAKLKRLIFFSQSLTFLVGILGIVLTYQFGFQFLSLWLHNAQIAAKIFPVLKVMSVFLAINALAPLPSVILNGLNFPQIPSISAVVTTIINITLIILLVPNYGAIGAAYAALYSNIIMAPIFLIIFHLTINKFQKDLVS